MTFVRNNSSFAFQLFFSLSSHQKNISVYTLAETERSVVFSVSKSFHCILPVVSSCGFSVSLFTHLSFLRSISSLSLTSFLSILFICLLRLAMNVSWLFLLILLVQGAPDYNDWTARDALPQTTTPSAQWKTCCGSWGPSSAAYPADMNHPRLWLRNRLVAAAQKFNWLTYQVWPLSFLLLFLFPLNSISSSITIFRNSLGSMEMKRKA